MERVLDHDFRLLRHGPSERAVAHRLAVYLEQEFPGWDIDCEYNRQGDEGERKKINVAGHPKGREADPDIIVHRRGPQGPNLLAIEVKPTDATEAEKKYDKTKLERYILDHKYAHAAFITYSTGESAGTYDVVWLIRTG
jgi:hypothetical protein